METWTLEGRSVEAIMAILEIALLRGHYRALWSFERLERFEIILEPCSDRLTLMFSFLIHSIEVWACEWRWKKIAVCPEIEPGDRFKLPVSILRETLINLSSTF